MAKYPLQLEADNRTTGKNEVYILVRRFEGQQIKHLPPLRLIEIPAAHRRHPIKCDTTTDTLVNPAFDLFGGGVFPAEPIRDGGKD